MDYRNKIGNILLKLPHKIQVEFSLSCSKDCIQYVREQDKEVINNTLSLVQKWLLDDTSVTTMELENAANSAYTAAHAAAHAAADAAADAAYTAANAAYAAADAAADAAYTAANAATAAYAAANAAAYDTVRDEKYKQYHDYLLYIIKNLSKLERIVYGLK